jgi:hypothetical protein
MEQFAYTVPGGETVQVPNGLPDPGKVGAGDVVGFVLGILLAVAVVGAVGLLIWGAIGWITSQGDKQKLQKARSTIIAAVIGLIIVLLAFVIISALGRVLGIEGWMTIGGKS